MLGVAGDPPVARAPGVPASGWDAFSHEALLEALAALPGASPFSDRVQPVPPAPNAVPEPGAGVLTGLGLTALALARRRSDPRQ